MGQNKKKSKSKERAKSGKEQPSAIKLLVKIICNLTFLAIFVIYAVFVFRPIFFHNAIEKFPQIKPVETIFKFIEEYSPFHEFLRDEQQDSIHMNNQRTKTATRPPKEKIFTKLQLKEYDGFKENKGPYLAVLGQVFDVSKGKDHYGPGGGYSFFSGVDGSRAFVSGDFTDDGLTDDVTGLSEQDYLGLKEWTDFYHKDYTYVGKVIGKFYDERGQETKYAREVQKWILAAEADKEAKHSEQQMFPSCNSEWSEAKGHRVWCTKKSGGVQRNWVGRPRRLFYPGRSERCACVKDLGPPSTDPGAKSNVGDLENPHLKEYEGCDWDAQSCQVSSPEKEEL